MWTIKDLKEKGKAAFKANYWICVVVALIIGILTVGEGSATKAGGNDDDQTVIESVEEDVADIPGSVEGLVAGIVGVGVLLSAAIDIFVKNIFTVGIADFFLENSAAPAKLSTILSGFKENYGKKALTMFLKKLFIALWSILFVIPGIVKTYQYRLVEYIISDRPELTWKEALDESKRLMNGNKWRAFVLDLSFLGWVILGIIPLVSVLWTTPYIHATNAELYLALKAEK